MMSFADLPVRRQLTLVILAACAVVLLLACAALAAFGLIDARRALVRDSTVLADIVGTNAQAALAFDDADAGRKLLRSLHAEPHILMARLYDRDGAPFADFVRTDQGNPDGAPALPDAAGDEGQRFADGLLVVVRAVALDGRRLGTIRLHVGLQGVHDRLALFAWTAGAVLIGTLLLALALASRLQRPISRPLLALAGTATAIATRRDFSVRAPAAGGGELGALTAAFNHMLEQIQQQNRELTESAELVRAILDTALSAVVVSDHAGRISEWNARAEELFGWSRAEALGRDLAATIFPDELGGEYTRALARHTPGDGASAERVVELDARRRDGGGFTAELSLSALRRGGELTFCCFITDITTRKQSASRLQEQLARLDLLNRITRAIGERQDLPSILQVAVRSLEENLPIDFCCVCLHDAAAGSLTVSNVGVRSVAHADDLALELHTVVPIAQNGLTRCLDGQLVYESDIGRSPFPFLQRLAGVGLRSLVAAPLLIEGKVFGVLLAARRLQGGFSSPDCEFLRQLSDHVALAAHQAQLHGALQQAYDDLRQTQQAVMQQERLRALGQMASGIAHDINNAISPVMLYSEWLLDKEPDLSVKARKYLEIIQRAIEDVAHTVARLGEFYRKHEQQLSLTPVDLNQLVPQVLDLTRARWSDMPQQRGLVVQAQTELASGLPAVMGIASEVREALINLVFNAVDAMPEGGTVTVRTRVLAGTGGAPGRIAVEVTDTGTGMDEETRRRCLEPFFTTKGERGTGLGLAMVYGVLQRHHGEIEIDSVPGRGTTMRLAFPLPLATATTELIGVAPAAPPTGLRLLVVDDDPLLLKSLVDILSGDGHQVTAANHGQSGIATFTAALAGAEPFAAVITDLGMPHVDGRAVAMAVKTAAPHTPVILLTGWGQRLVAEGDVPPHVDCVLNKPPKLRDLRAALARLCQPATSGAGR